MFSAHSPLFPGQSALECSTEEGVQTLGEAFKQSAVLSEQSKSASPSERPGELRPASPSIFNRVLHVGLECGI